jgi:hypothetical protein
MHRHNRPPVTKKRREIIGHGLSLCHGIGVAAAVVGWNWCGCESCSVHLVRLGTGVQEPTVTSNFRDSWRPLQILGGFRCRRGFLGWGIGKEPNTNSVVHNKRVGWARPPHLRDNSKKRKEVK